MSVRTALSEYKLSIAVIVIVCLLAFLAQHIVRADGAFSHAYLEYAVAADEADTAAYIPTATNNPLRQELNAILNTVLGNSTSRPERLQKAKRGLELLQLSERQIDDITPKNDAVLASIVAMEKSTSPGDALFQRGDPPKIIAFAKERAAAVSDIRALSYRADFEIHKILQHIVDANGELSDIYVRELNSTIPALEQEFNKRQNRYNDLERLLNDIQVAYADFRAATQGAF